MSQPVPADDGIESVLDLNTLLIKNRAATFFVKMTGESMQGVGIYPGDILVVDRALAPSSGKIVIAVIDGEFVVKKMLIAPEGITLEAANPRFPTLKIHPEKVDFQVWGIVTAVVRKC